MNFGDLSLIDSHRMWNTVTSRQPHLSPLGWDWEESWPGGERWCLGFDVSRHAIPYQHPLPFPGGWIDARNNNLPELPEWQKLSAVEFDVFERRFYVQPTESKGEVIQILRMNEDTYAAIYERIQIKLADEE